MIVEKVESKTIPSHQKNSAHTPVFISEGLHVLNPSFYDAVIGEDELFLRSKAQKERTAGADALAVNLGPGKIMIKRFPWVVSTLAAAVDLPLFVSSGVLSCENVLEQYGARLVVNAITADPDTLAENMRTAKKFGLRMVVLLVQPGLVPAGIEDRLRIASEVIATALNIGLPLHHLYLDPVINCRPDPLSWRMSRGLPDIHSVLETIAWLKDMDQGIRTIVALGNGTTGLMPEKKSILQNRILCLFTSVGLDAVILNCLDKNLMKNECRKTYATYHNGKYCIK